MASPAEISHRRMDRVGRITSVILGVALVGTAAWAGYERFSPDAHVAQAVRLAKQGIINRGDYQLSFPQEGVVRVDGNFDRALKDVGDLCGVPKSMTHYRVQTIEVGHIGVDDPRCLAPLKGELSGSVQLNR